MRRLSPLAQSAVALGAALLLRLSPARADDPVIPGDSDKPAFTAYDVALAEAGLPEGWKLGPSDPPSADEKAVRDEVDAAAKPKGETVSVVVRALATADGKPVTVVLVDSEKDPKAFAAALTESATKHGWGSRDLGSPARLVVVVGPADARDKALAAQVAWALKMLETKEASAAAMKTIPATRRAYGLARAVLALDGKHAPSHMVAGRVIWQLAQQQMAEARPEQALPHFQSALAKDATSPLEGDDAVIAYGELGGLLLNVKPPKDAEGRDALKEAVKRLPASTVPRNAALTYRYNLACAHGRLKEKEEAFTLLTALLADIAKEPDEQLEDIWRKDEDFTNLKDDPRWADLLKKYPEKKEGGADAGGGN